MVQTQNGSLLIRSWVQCKWAAMTSSDLTRSLIGHTMGELYPFWGEVTPMVLTAKSPA